MKGIISLILFLFCVSTSLSSQTRIKMKEEGGIYTIPCKVNGLNLRFILDTGASSVCISLSEAIFMLKNNYLNASDIIGSSNVAIADGSLVENTQILLREIEIGGLKLHNVKAVVMHNLEAPLLLGQSAIQQLGAVQLQGDELIILNGKDNSSTARRSTGTYWYELYDDDEIKIEVDLNSIKRESDYVTVYEKWTYVDENHRKEKANSYSDDECKGALYEECVKIKQKWEDYQYRVVKTIYCCEKGTYDSLSVAHYSKNGRVIDRTQFSTKRWSDILPETIAASLLDSLCSQYRFFHNGKHYVMYIENAVLFLDKYPSAILL